MEISSLSTDTLICPMLAIPILNDSLADMIIAPDFSLFALYLMSYRHQIDGFIASFAHLVKILPWLFRKGGFQFEP